MVGWATFVGGGTVVSHSVVHPFPSALPLIETNTTFQQFPPEDCCAPATYGTVSFIVTIAFKKQLTMNPSIVEQS